MPTFVVATRSAHKLREIREILSDVRSLRLLDLDEAGVEASPDEDAIEVFDTFTENALAKARYFSEKTGLAALADDSGLCVDALGGQPGVRSKRFSGRTDLSGGELDRANNDLLLERLHGVPEDQRAARYVCAVALAWPSGEELVAEGEAAGSILESPRGSGGFGYDPLMLAAGTGLTFAELPPEEKNRISHRARALAAAAELLRSRLSD